MKIPMVVLLRTFNEKEHGECFCVFLCVENDVVNISESTWTMGDAGEG